MPIRLECWQREGGRMEIVWVGLGGFVGANARYLIGRLALAGLGGAFPYGTLIANLTGCCLIGAVMALLAERGISNPTWRLLLVVGVLGGYTTFSSFAYETVTLLEQGRAWRATAYVLVSNAGGILACAAGLAAVRAVLR
jgi:CrcB protein